MKGFYLFISMALIFLSCAKKEPGPSLIPSGQEYKTSYNSMQLVGDFNLWNLDDIEGTGMQLVSDWTWQKLQYFGGQKDSIMFKFVANSSWDIAFGTEGADTGLSGYAELLHGGTGNHISAGPITQPGFWKFTFNEQTMYYSISFYAAPGGAVTGKVSFSNVPAAPFPSALIELFDNTWAQVTSTQSDTASGNYTLTNIPNGTYSLIASAQGYAPDTISDVVVNNDTATVNISLVKMNNIVVDGNLSDWDTCAVYDTLGDSKWGSDGDLGSLYAKIINNTLYIGIAAEINDYNVVLVYIHADSLAGFGTTNADSIDFYPRLFTFPDTSAPQYVLAQQTGDSGARRINLDYTTTDIMGSIEMASTLTAGSPGAVEAAIPLNLLFGGTSPAGASIKIVAIVAGGDHYDGPESVPDNPTLQGNGSGALITNMYKLFVGK